MDMTLLYPPFAEKVKAIQTIVKERHGLICTPYSGLRTPEEQARIYSVGRTTPSTKYTIQGITVTSPTLKEYPSYGIVSKAQPFLSPHQWGLGVDFGWMRDGRLKFDPLAKADWKFLYQAAKEVGCRDITASVPWDLGHIEYGKPWIHVWNHMEAMKHLYLTGGIKAVFAELDKLK